MLIQEYRRFKMQGWQQIREYYWFPVAIPDDDAGSGSRTLKPRHECPGCGRMFTSLFMRQHECLGGTPEYPRLRTRRAMAQPAADEIIEEYIKNSGHTVVAS